MDVNGVGIFKSNLSVQSYEFFNSNDIDVSGSDNYKTFGTAFLSFSRWSISISTPYNSICTAISN